jgi:hypothetical protein
MKHAEIIDRLGGNRSVAQRLGRDRTSVSRWRILGIPAVAWPHILKLASTHHIPLSLDDLHDNSPRFGKHGTSRLRVKRTRAKESA